MIRHGEEHRFPRVDQPFGDQQTGQVFGCGTALQIAPRFLQLDHPCAEGPRVGAQRHDAPHRPFRVTAPNATVVGNSGIERHGAAATAIVIGEQRLLASRAQGPAGHQQRPFAPQALGGRDQPRRAEPPHEIPDPVQRPPSYPSPADCPTSPTNTAWPTAAPPPILPPAIGRREEGGGKPGARPLQVVRIGSVPPDQPGEFDVASSTGPTATVRAHAPRRPQSVPRPFPRTCLKSSFLAARAVRSIGLRRQCD